MGQEEGRREEGRSEGVMKSASKREKSELEYSSEREQNRDEVSCDGVMEQRVSLVNQGRMVKLIGGYD